jgi:Tfp pilus assembly protein PilP
MNNRFMAIALASMVSLAGCSNDGQHSDLDEKMSDARTRPRGLLSRFPSTRRQSGLIIPRWHCAVLLRRQP